MAGDAQPDDGPPSADGSALEVLTRKRAFGLGLHGQTLCHSTYPLDDIWKRHPSGGTWTRLARVPGYEIQYLAIDDDYVFFTSFYRATLGQVSLDDGEVTLLATMQAGIKDVALDDAYAYWTALELGTVNRVPKSGGEFEILAQAQARPSGLAVDGQYVYWVNRGNLEHLVPDGSLMRAAKGGGAAETLLDGLTLPISVAIDATDIYLVDFGAGTILRVPKLGGAPFVVADAEINPFHLAVDDSAVYWGTRPESNGYLLPGEVRRWPKAGGPAETLATDPWGPVIDLAIDDESIYWTDEHMVLRISK